MENPGANCTNLLSHGSPLKHLLTVWRKHKNSDPKRAAIEVARLWPLSSPLLSDEVPPEEAARINYLLAMSCTESTIKSYRTHIRSFFRVMAKLGIDTPLPLTEEILLRYVTEKAGSGSVSAPSVSTYLNGVLRLHHDVTGSPFARTDHIRGIIRAFAREDPNRQTVDDVRQIFSSAHLSRLILQLLRPELFPHNSYAPDAGHVFTITVATLTLMRSCQMYKLAPIHCQLWMDPLAGPTFSYVVPYGKEMDPISSSPQRKNISAVPGLFDPALGDWFSLIVSVMNYCRKVEPDLRVPFVTTLGISSKPSPSVSLSRLISACFKGVDVPDAHVTSHSCRKTGTAESLALGVLPDKVRIHGCWKHTDYMLPYTNLTARPSKEGAHFFGHLLPPHNWSMWRSL